jgi:hypothetical protein
MVAYSDSDDATSAVTNLSSLFSSTWRLPSLYAQNLESIRGMMEMGSVGGTLTLRPLDVVPRDEAPLVDLNVYV